MIGRALERTAALWPDVEYAYRFVHAVAHWLGNPHEESAAMVRRRVNGVLGAMQRYRDKAGTLAGAFAHFQKVTRSYRPGLFHTYAVPDLPRTNNDLEQRFGSQRYHERRDRPQDGSPWCGSARFGAAARRYRDARAGAHGARPGSREPGALEELASAPGERPPGANPAHPLPARSRRLPGGSRTAGLPVSFAVLVFLGRSLRRLSASQITARHTVTPVLSARRSRYSRSSASLSSTTSWRSTSRTAASRREGTPPLCGLG